MRRPSRPSLVGQAQLEARDAVFRSGRFCAVSARPRGALPGRRLLDRPDRRLDVVRRSAALARPASLWSTPRSTTTLTHELDERADHAAAGLADLGIASGDRVLLQLPNGCEFAVALFALLRAGAIPVMCLPGHRAAELGHFAAVSEGNGSANP